jgi:cache domain-containing protein
MKSFAPVPIALFVGALASSPAFAADYGTEKEARAMLDKVVAELKKGEAAAVAKFNKFERDFKDRDLYPFCFTPDGMTTVHPTERGKNVKDFKDKSGKSFGAEMLKVAETGKYKEVTYMWPRPGQTEPMNKASLVTKVGNQVCGVGYYKQ